MSSKQTYTNTKIKPIITGGFKQSYQAFNYKLDVERIASKLEQLSESDIKSLEIPKKLDNFKKELKKLEINVFESHQRLYKLPLSMIFISNDKKVSFDKRMHILKEGRDNGIGYYYNLTNFYNKA